MDIKAFNEGKPIDAADSGNGFDPVVWKVVDVSIAPAAKIKHPLAEAVALKDSKANMIKFDLATEKGEKHTEYQVLKVNEKETVIFHTSPRGEYNGNTYPATFLYDLKKAALEYDPSQEGQLNKPFSKERYVGIKFKIGTKMGTSKDGNDYVILETDYQKLKNEQYKQAQSQVDEAFEDDSVDDAGDLPF